MSSLESLCFLRPCVLSSFSGVCGKIHAAQCTLDLLDNRTLRSHSKMQLTEAIRMKWRFGYSPKSLGEEVCPQLL